MPKLIIQGLETSGTFNEASNILYNSIDTGLSSNNVQNAITEVNSKLINLILDKLYPVGSIYLETTNTNPGTKLGGTWEAYGTSDSYLRLGGNGNGGSNSITLSIANLPSHTHGIPSLSGSTSTNGEHSHTASGWYGNDWLTNTQFTCASSSQYSSNNMVQIQSNGNHSHTVTTNASTSNATGNGTAVNIAPKYVQVYAWKRIA